MKSLSAPTISALGSGSVAIVQLVHLAFSPTPIAFNTSTWDLLWGGVTYKGAYGLGSVSAIEDSPGQIRGITFDLAAGDPAFIALALDSADDVQGTICTIRTAIIETATYTILDAPVEWVGILDTMGIGEDGDQATIRVTAESRAVDLLRGNPSYYNNPDQRAINPNDGAFAYVLDQIDKPVVWPAKEFFYR